MATLDFSFTIEPASGSGGSSTFYLTVEDWIGPFVRNASPFDGETGLDGYVTISMDILDDATGVNLSTVNISVDGYTAFTGPSSFVAPWNGAGSSISATTVDGYAGYHITLVGTELYAPRTTHHIDVSAYDNYGNSFYYADPDSNPGSQVPIKFDIGAAVSAVSVGTYETNLIVTFSHDMDTDNPQLFNPANYTFINGMYARYAEVIDAKNVLLEVERFHTFEDFTLTVGSNVTDDAYGDPLPSQYNNIDFSPFQSSANISNFNAKIRTWRHGNVIQADSERIYIAGTRGIDVLRKENPARPVRWAQVLDEYGAQAMFVMNYPNDLVVVDMAAPTLTNQNPAPNATVPSVSEIVLTITDVDTAVEPTSTTIYVNGVVAFAGGFGGWSNNYSGSLVVDYKELNFTLIPPTPFTLGEIVSVRVVATDLLGNRLDRSYQFSIGTSAIIEGWGGENWGSYDAYGITLLPWGGTYPWL